MPLTRASSIQMQNEIGADVIMALDDVISSQTTGERVEEVPAPPASALHVKPIASAPHVQPTPQAMHRTIRWIDRCIAAHTKPHSQNLFGIVQGGLDPELRRYCTAQLVAPTPSPLLLEWRAVTRQPGATQLARIRHRRSVGWGGEGRVLAGGEAVLRAAAAGQAQVHDVCVMMYIS
jgi:hypothetical protein